MKSKFKIYLITIILAILFSFFYIHFLSVSTYIIYVCQVGIFEQADNASNMISSLQSLNYQGEIVEKEDTYVVYNEIFIDEQLANDQATILSEEGFSVIVNEYVVDKDTYQKVENNEYEGMVWE